MIWLFVGACSEQSALEDTASSSAIEQGSSWKNGFCEEPEISGEPVGQVDCQNDRCRISAGEFWMGSAYSIDECPVRSVTLDEYWIDAKEVSINQWNICKQFGSCTEIPTHCQNWNEAREDYSSNLPINCVTWEQAQDYCSWSGGRLPTEAEWEKASRGNEGAIWAWGSLSPDCDKANFRLASIYCYGGSTNPVDDFEQSRSAYGLWNTNGNVFEWTADFYDAQYYQEENNINPTGPIGDCHTSVEGETGVCQFRVIRGGAYNTTEDVIRSAARSFAEPELVDLNVGFRCAYSASQRN